jgi:hypothetical protein
LYIAVRRFTKVSSQETAARKFKGRVLAHSTRGQISSVSRDGGSGKVGLKRLLANFREISRN